MSEKLKSLLEAAKTVEQAPKFKEFVPKIRLNLMAEVEDSSSAVRHLSQVFQTDRESFEIPQWQSSLTANDPDMELVPTSVPKSSVLHVS